MFFLDESFRKPAIVHKFTRRTVVVTFTRNLRQFPIVFPDDWFKSRNFVIRDCDKRFTSAKIVKNVFQHLGCNMLTSVVFYNEKSTNLPFCRIFFQRCHAGYVAINGTDNNFTRTIKNSWNIF